MNRRLARWGLLRHEARGVLHSARMVYPADDLLLRARLVRKAAQDGAKPTCTLLHEITGLLAEVEARARDNATSEGAPPPPRKWSRVTSSSPLPPDGLRTGSSAQGGG